MALESLNNKTIFTCNGALVDFDADFKIFDDADAEILLYTIATGASVVLTDTTHYAISLKTDTGFRITTVATYSSAYKIIARRSLTNLLKQVADWQRGGDFDTDILEKGLDKRLMAELAIYELISRVVVLDPTQTANLTLPGAVANKFLGWNSAGTALENKTAADLTAVEKASSEDVITGTDDNKFVTSAGVKAKMDAPGAIGGTTPATGTFTDLVATGNVYNVVWTDYKASSTIVGFTGAIVGNINYKKIGKLVFISYYLNGTSNATGLTFTVPYAIATPTQYSVGATSDDGGAVTVGTITITASGSVITLNHGVGGAWTASGVKTAFGQFFYEAA